MTSVSAAAQATHFARRRNPAPRRAVAVGRRSSGGLVLLSTEGRRLRSPGDSRGCAPCPIREGHPGRVKGAGRALGIGPGHLARSRRLDRD